MALMPPGLELFDGIVDKHFDKIPNSAFKGESYHPRKLKKLTPKQLRRRREERKAAKQAGGAAGAAAAEDEAHDHDSDETSDDEHGHGDDDGSASDAANETHKDRDRDRDWDRRGDREMQGRERRRSVAIEDEYKPERAQRRQTVKRYQVPERGDFAAGEATYAYRPRSSPDDFYAHEQQRAVQDEIREADAQSQRSATQSWLDDTRRNYSPTVVTTTDSNDRSRHQSLTRYESKPRRSAHGRHDSEDDSSGGEGHHSDAGRKSARPLMLSRRSNSVGAGYAKKRLDDRFDAYGKGTEIYSRRVVRRRVDEESGDEGLGRRRSRRGTRGEGGDRRERRGESKRESRDAGGERRGGGKKDDGEEKENKAKHFVEAHGALMLGALAGAWAGRQAESKAKSKGGKDGGNGVTGTVMGAAIGGLIGDVLAGRLDEKDKKNERRKERN